MKFKVPAIKKKTVFANLLHLFSENPAEILYALKDVNLEIQKGDSIGVVGNNGTGKTTLLSVIAGIINPDKGRCMVEGKVLPLLGLGIGFERELSVRDNVYLYGSILGMRNKDVADRLSDILEFAEIERFRETKLMNFSAGMTSRLAFSIAIMSPFDILILDEVLEVGDKNFIKKSFDKIKEFRVNGKTIILASHNNEMIRGLCEKTLWISDGEIKGFGETGEILNLYMKSKYTG